VGWAEPGVCALLISSSKIFGGGYLDHAEAAIRELLTMVRRVLFIPHALAKRDAYAEVARTRFEAMGFELASLHADADPRAAVEAAEAVVVGGGNTFRLLKALNDLGVLAPLRARALTGMPYIGASAGTNVACPTVRTTNDMPIVEPASLTALGLVRFQVNPTTSTRTELAAHGRDAGGAAGAVPGGERRSGGRPAGAIDAPDRGRQCDAFRDSSRPHLPAGMAPLEVPSGARLDGTWADTDAMSTRRTRNTRRRSGTM